jgi:hypothetical protein
VFTRKGDNNTKKERKQMFILQDVHCCKLSYERLFGKLMGDLQVAVLST